jgi:S-adenosylmethionine hydrolase
MARRYDTVSFLSDFGTRDEFVGVVKSVVRDLAPHAMVIDLTHEIAAFDIRAGSLALARTIAYVPSGVVLAVVDPGVGTHRKAVAIEVADGEGVLVGPDNGLLAPAVAMAGGAGRAVVLTNTEYQLAAAGATFAGRDIFAPAAAHLCNGVDLFELGEPIDADLLVPGVVPLPREDAGSIVCEVLWVDRFGNCQLNLGPDEVQSLGRRLQVSVGDLAGEPTVRIALHARTFDEIGVGAVGLVTDSYGMLALSLARRSAADELHIAAGDQVLLSPLSPEDGGAGAAAAPPTSVNMSPSRPRQ